MALKGLVIRQPWIGMILCGEKTWEMRSQPCRHRGPIALIEKGSGTVVAMARIVDDLAPLSEAELRSTIDKHGIPLADIPDAVRNGWVRPWVLADVVRLPSPVPYNHTSGGSWVNLTEAEEAAVRSAAGGQSPLASAKHAAERTSPRPTRSLARPGVAKERPSPLPLALGTMPGAERTAQMHKLAHIGGNSVRSITDADVSASVTRTGNKIVIDVSWDDASWGQSRSGSLSGWAEIIGTFAVAAAMFCLLGFIIHFALGMVSGSISALSAFKWWIPMVVSMIVATLLGQGHLFDGLVENR